MTRLVFLFLLLTLCPSLAAAQPVRTPALQARVGIDAAEVSGVLPYGSRTGMFSGAADLVSSSAAGRLGRPSLRRPGGQVPLRVGTSLLRMVQEAGRKRMGTGRSATANGPEGLSGSRLLYATGMSAEQANGQRRLLQRVGTVMSLAGVGLMLGSFLLLDEDDARPVRYAGAGTLLVGSGLLLLSRVLEQLPGPARRRDGRTARGRAPRP